MNNIDCKIKKYPRDTRTEWLVIETEDFAILQIASEDCIHISSSIRSGVLIKTKNGLDLKIENTKNHASIFCDIDRKTMKKKQYDNFCKVAGFSLIKKFDNYLNNIKK